MIASYDLSCNPPTYDVVAFLAHAELERRRIGAEKVRVLILPGPADGFRRDGLWPRTTRERVILRDKLVVPLCRMLPAVEEVEVSGARTAENTFGFRARHISLPAIMKALRAGCRPLRPRHESPPWRGLITFTLREADHHPLRNSRTEEWVAAARELRSAGQTVVIIRDTARAREPIEDVPTAVAAALDLETRAALYAQADLNVGICNGPMWMAVFMNASVLMLRPTTNAAGGCYDDAFYAKCGLHPGDQLPTSPAHQRLVWEDDSRDNIVQAVEEVLQWAP